MLHRINQEKDLKKVYIFAGQMWTKLKSLLFLFS